MRSALLAALAACGFPQPADVGGDGGVTDAMPLPAGKVLDQFAIPRKLNMDRLAHDLRIEQHGMMIDVYTLSPQSVPLTATFHTDGAGVTANGVAQTSGTTKVTFAGTVTYTVTGQDGSTATYLVTMHVARLSSFVTPLPTDHESAPTAVAFGDLDGDHLPDIVLGDNLKYLTVFHNTSASSEISFLAKAGGTTSYEPDALAITDLEGDGVIDVLSGTLTPNTSIATYHVMPGLLLQPTAINFGAGYQTTAIAIGPVFAPHTADIATATGGGNGGVVVPNDSTDMLELGTPVPLGNTGADVNTVAVALLDLDGDQKTDVALAASNAGRVDVLLSSNNFSPQSGATLPGLTTPSSLGVGDLDNDGHQELFIGEGNFVDVFFKIPGGFQTVRGATTGLVQCIAVADLDGDGRSDVAAATLDGGLEILLATDSFDLREETSFSMTPGTIVGCAATDLDHDGVTDLIVVGGGGVQGLSVTW